MSCAEFCETILIFYFILNNIVTFLEFFNMRQRIKTFYKERLSYISSIINIFSFSETHPMTIGNKKPKNSCNSIYWIGQNWFCSILKHTHAQKATLNHIKIIYVFNRKSVSNMKLGQKLIFFNFDSSVTILNIINVQPITHNFKGYMHIREIC